MNEILRLILFLPRQASTLARSVDYLHYFVILTTIFGSFAITVIGGYFVIRYRRRPEDGDFPRNPAKKPPLLMEGSVVVGLFALFIGWWAIGNRLYLELRTPPANAMRVYVTAKQWMWKFAYPEGAQSLSMLYVPRGRPVELILTSRDVIHSFFVPAFRIKQDAVPGRFTTAWFEASSAGRYRIFCTEYCGAGHSTMLGEVVVLEPEVYARWLAGAAPNATIPGPVYTPPAVVGEAAPRQELSLPAMGKAVAARLGCLGCHTLDGAAHIGPTWAGLYGRQVPLNDGTTVVADDAFLTESIMDPGAKVHAGYPPVMPGYFGRLQPAETAAIVELIQSLRDVAPAAPQKGAAVGTPVAGPSLDGVVGGAKPTAAKGQPR